MTEQACRVLPKAIRSVLIAVLFLALASSCSSREGDVQSALPAADEVSSPTLVPAGSPIAAQAAAAQAAAAQTTFANPGWWDDERRSRQSNWSHLTGDIEETLGRIAPFLLESGTYTTAQLGVDLTFSSLDGSIALIQENPGLIDLGLRNVTSGFIEIMRPSSVYEGAARYSANGIVEKRAVTSPVPEDLGAWLEADEALLISNRQELDIGGFEATSYDVVVDGDSELPFPCQLGPQCVLTLRAGGGGIEAYLFDTLNKTRFYEVELPGTDLVIFANATLAEFDAMVLDLDRLVESIRLEDPGPTPFDDDMIWEANTFLGPGSYRFGGLGPAAEIGVQSESQVLNQHGLLCLRDAELLTEGGVCIFRVEADEEGAPLASIEAVVASLGSVEGANVEIVALDDEPMLATIATTISMRSDTPGPRLHHASPPGGERWTQAMWTDESEVKLWLVSGCQEIWAVSAQASTPDGLDIQVQRAFELFGELELDSLHLR